jgi:hypothetical protein
MFTVENETVIHTSLPRVWTAITRFDDYPRWHPFVRITGSLTSDTKVDYSFRMKTGNAPFRTVDARIVTVDEQRCFALRFGLGKLFALEESYLLSAIPPGARVVHSFRCTGLLSLLPLKVRSDFSVRCSGPRTACSRGILRSAGRQLHPGVAPGRAFAPVLKIEIGSGLPLEV